MKKFFVSAVISISILVSSCGSDKITDRPSDEMNSKTDIAFEEQAEQKNTLKITPEEFQRRYNANLAYLKGLDYDKLKIDGFSFNNSEHFYNNNNPNDFIDHDWMITAKLDSNEIKELNITTRKKGIVFELLVSAIFHSVESEDSFSDEKQVTELIDMLGQMMRELKPFNGNENDKRSFMIHSGYKYEFSARKFSADSNQTATITITLAKPGETLTEVEQSQHSQVTNPPQVVQNSPVHYESEKGITPKEFMRRYNSNLAATSANYDMFKINATKNENNVFAFYNDSYYLFIISAEKVNGSKEFNKWTVTTFHGTEDLPFVTSLLLSSLDNDKVASQETNLNNISLAYTLIQNPTSRLEGNNVIYEKRTEDNGRLYNFSLLIERDKLGRVTNSTGFLTVEIK